MSVSDVSVTLSLFFKENLQRLRDSITRRCKGKGTNGKETKDTFYYTIYS